MYKRVIILAGGKGTRLKPYSIAIPKPLVPVGDVPILEIIITQLRNHGFNHITLAVNHMADIIKAFFGDGSKWNVKVDYVFESKALSTMGPLSIIADLPDNFLVMNGDILTDLDFGLFFDEHLKSNNIFTIAAHRRVERIDYGVLHSGKDGRLIKFEEKPSYHFLVSMGIYGVNSRVLNYIPQNSYYGFDHLMNRLLTESEYPSIYEYNGEWLDIGRPEDYETAIKSVENNQHKL